MKNIGQYQIEIYNDKTFKKFSVDNVHEYDYVYINDSLYEVSTVFGIKVYSDHKILTSAVIGSIGGGNTNLENITILKTDKLIICCSDLVFCLSIPDLKLLWQTKADDATCFEIFKYKEDYIIHGELKITRIDYNGNIVWQQSGADIFTTLDGIDTFKLTEEFIIVKDWENRIYHFDYDGQNLTDMKQFSKWFI